MEGHAGKAQHGNAGRWFSWVAVALLLFACHAASAREFADYRFSFGEGAFSSVQDLAVARDGQSVVLSDYGQVRRYSLSGDLLDRLCWQPPVPYSVSPLVSIACGEDGEVYVGDYYWGTIKRLDQHGAVMASAGGVGPGPGEFGGLTCMALAPDGTLYVGDFGSDRVQHFSADLQFLDQWALPPAPDEYHTAGPDAMACDSSGRLWVAWASYLGEDGTLQSGRIIAYAPDGKEVSAFPVERDPGDHGQGGSWFFRDIAFSPAEQLWVLLDGSPTMAKLVTFDASGARLAAVPLPDGTDQSALLPDGTIAVTSFGQITAQHPEGTSWVQRLTPSGELIEEWGFRRWAAARATGGLLADARHIALDPWGRVLVAGGFSKEDASYNVVPAFSFLNRYRPDGAFDANLFAEDDPPESNWYLAIAPDGTPVRSSQSFGIDRAGNRYTLDSSDQLHTTVRKADPDGNLVAVWEVAGDGSPQACIGMDDYLYIERAVGFGIGGYGYLFRIEKYDLDGNLVSRWEVPGFDGLLAIDPAGRDYVFDRDLDGTSSVKVYAPSRGGTDLQAEVPQGKLLATIGAGGEEVFLSLSSVALSPEGRLVVAEANRLHVFQLTPSRFSDISLWFWAKDDIEAVADAGIVAGFADGSYQPSRAVDRAQMAVYLARALAGGEAGVPTGPARPSFKDVPTDSWAYKYVEYLKDRGGVEGTVQGEYLPEAGVDRGAMAVFLARALVGGKTELPAGPTQPTFPDVSSWGPWAWCYDAVEYLAAQGVVSGYGDGDYHPEDPVDRAQLAVFIARAFAVAEAAAAGDTVATRPSGLRRVVQ